MRHHSADFKLKGMDDEAVKSLITKDNFEKYKAKSRDNTVRALKVIDVYACALLIHGAVCLFSLVCVYGIVRGQKRGDSALKYLI
jgi:hypothetical protein